MKYWADLPFSLVTLILIVHISIFCLMPDLCYCSKFVQRSILYRLLTRILHRLSAHPVSSPAAIGLRRLLRWLSTMTDTLFPWLNINEMASDGRLIVSSLVFF